MKRQDYPGGIIELQHDNIMNKWLVVRKILHGASKVTQITVFINAFNGYCSIRQRLLLQK